MKLKPSSIASRILTARFVAVFSGALLLLAAVPSAWGQSIFNGPRDYPVGTNPDSGVVGDFNGDGLPDVAVANQYSSNISVLLQNTDGSFQPAVNYAVGAVGSQPMWLQTGDVNGDGKPDLLVFNSQANTISVLIGNGDGTFQTQKVTSVPNISSAYIGITVGNFNGDQYLDVAISVSLAQVGTSGIGVLLGNGDGTFQPAVNYQVSGPPLYIAAADFNNDGKIDLVASGGNGTSGTVSVLLGNGDGTFQTPINTALSYYTNGLVVADFNQDGNLDIATSVGAAALQDEGDLFLMYGNGDGTFQVQQPLSIADVPLIAGDLNGDGKPDLIAGFGSDESGAESLINNGNGTFTAGQKLPGVALALYDLLGNQKLDLITGQAGGNGDEGVVSIVRGNGDGTFAVFPSYAGSVSVAADFNGDGKIDWGYGVATIIPDIYADYVGVSLNTGSGFSAPTQIQLPGSSPSVSATEGDFNGDGRADLAAATSNVAILLGNGDGTFQNPTYWGSGVGGPIVTGDFNNDGNLDVLGVGAGLAVLPGNGDGTFGFPVSSSVGANLGPVYAMAVADFNQDENLDAVVLVSNSNPPYGQANVMLGSGNGSFSPGVTFSFNLRPTAVATGDLNGDGIPDIIVAVSSGADVQYFNASVVVFLGKGDGTFQAPITTYAGDGISAIVVADFNGDGRQDVAISNSGWNDISLLLGNGDGTFQTPVQYSSGGYNLVVADFDGNGSPDLAVGVGFGQVDLLLNAGTKGSAALVSPTALAFGNQTVGQASAAQTIILSNTNSAALSISGIAVSGAQSGDFQQSSTCGTSLAAGGNCTVTVSFTPQAAGARTALLQVSDNAINSPQSISLGGTGIAVPDFTIGMASGGSSSTTIAAGGTATFGLAITPAGSFSGTVNFTCVVTPAASPAPVCSVPASVSVSGSSATAVTVSVTTTAAGGAVSGWFGDWPSGSMVGWALALGVSSLLFMGRGRRFGFAPVVVLILLMVGCGGGSSTPGPTPNQKGTPAGTYTATVTATSGSLSHQAALTVIVQ